MADDLAGTVERLQAELRQLQDQCAASRAENAALRTANTTLRDENVTLAADAERHRRDLSEALEQQAATAVVLRVIAASPTDVQVALDSIVETAVRLCDAPGGAIMQVRETDGRLALRANYGINRD